jgi:putative effector of murein hydrolase LrgA (UPF0299 family)
LFTNWCKKLCSILFFWKPKTNKLFKNKHLKIERPDEPSDILWENLGEHGALKRRVITTIATLLVLMVCAVIIYGSSWWKKWMKDDISDDPSDEEKTKVRFLAFIPGMIISVINISLARTVRFFGKLEKFDSYTSYNTSVAIKLVVAMFVNTAIIALIVYWDDWYGADSLIAEVYNIVLANAIMSPLLYFFSVGYIVRLVRQWYHVRQGEKSKLTQ